MTSMVEPSAPAPAVASAVLGFVCTLPALLLAAVVGTVTGLEGASPAQLWAGVPLGVTVGLVVGGVRLLRRRGAAVLIAAQAPLALAGALQVGLLAVEGAWSAGGPLVLLLLPGTSIGLALTPPVRWWLATGPPQAVPPSRFPADGQRAGGPRS
jgi:hypothetical protein